MFHQRNLQAAHMKATLALAGILGVCASGSLDLTAAPTPAAPPYSEIHQRATNEFACADYNKPAEARTNEPSFTLAPLILQEVNGPSEPPSLFDRFGTLSVSNGAPILDPSRPAVYWEADTVQLNGRAHARFSYVWCYFPRPFESGPGQGINNASPGRREAGLPLQGIRMTLSSAGQPLIWEVLADNSKTKLFFVSQSLEAAAVAEFGKPLPGRRYAIERSLEAAPDVIVARVIDDSPLPLGPIVYLCARTRQVSTLVCRCMPAQARRLLSTRTYNLLPFQEASTNSLIIKARLMLKEREAFWPADDASRKGLGACLRLPGSFSNTQGAKAR